MMPAGLAPASLPATGGATQWIAPGAPLPADDLPADRMLGAFAPILGQPNAVEAPLCAFVGATAHPVGTVRVQAGIVTVSTADPARWGLRIALLAWIVGWLLWGLRQSRRY